MGTITGTSGNETLSGTSDADIFVFGANWGDDTVQGFDPAQDILDLSATGLSLANINAALRFDGTGAHLEIGAHSIFVAGVTEETFDLGAISTAARHGSALTSSSGSDLVSAGDTSTYQPEISLLSNGGYAVTWSQLGVNTNRTVMTRVFNAEGDAVTDPMETSHQNGNNQNYGATGLAGGGLVVTWYNFGTHKTFNLIYDNDGNVVKGPFEAGTKSEVGIIALDDGGYIQVSGPGYIQGHRFDANGNLLSVQNLSETFMPSLNTVTGTQLSTGEIVMIWDNFGEPHNVAFRVFDENLSPITGDIVANTENIGTAWLANIAALDNGNFVLTWSNWAIYTDEADRVSFRIFDASGNAVTDQMTVNWDGGILDQQYPEITALDDGGFAIIWHTSDQHILTQQFDADGKAVTEATRIDNGNGYSFNYPAIAQLADGTGIALWSSPGRDIISHTLTFQDDLPSANADSVHATAGDDYVVGLAGDDSLFGDTGNDTLIGGLNDDAMHGEGGQDQLYGGQGNDSMWGDGGDDTLVGGAGADTISGGTGQDLLDYTASNAGVMVDLGRGRGRRGDAEGDRFSDIEDIAGSAHNDTLIGDAGDNRLLGGDGFDFFDGGAGADYIHGGGDQDRVNYGASSSAVHADLDAGRGYAGDADGDVLIRIEELVGSDYNDTLEGSTGRNKLWGGDGNDLITANDGPDVLYGEAGNDTLDGGDGRDIIIGGTGDDSITGGLGNDIIETGTGSDTLVYADGHGGDFITDFDITLDLLGLTAITGIDSFADLNAEEGRMRREDGVFLHTSSGDFVFIAGVSISEIETATIVN